MHTVQLDRRLRLLLPGTLLLVTAGFLLLPAVSTPAPPPPPTSPLPPGGYTANPAVLDAIRTEATRSNRSSEGRPLPLASHWNTSTYHPGYVIQLIEAGHHVLPWGGFPSPTRRQTDQLAGYFRQLAAWKLPFSLRHNQLEQDLYRNEKYSSLPPERTPLVLHADGTIEKRLSPFGAVEPWYEVGKEWTSSAAMQLLQQTYPDPPLFIALSNNEPRDLEWQDAEKDRRFTERYGTGAGNQVKRQAFIDGWKERYTALFDGMRDGLASDAWRQHIRFVPYGGLGPAHLGRMGHWARKTLSTPRNTFHSYLIWQGSSASYYTHDWNASTDFRVWSPQIEAMNWVFMLDEAYAHNPEFWFELSVWDGSKLPTGREKKKRDKLDYYQQLGQTYTPERYKGMVQYGMWLLTPRVVREFRGSTTDLEQSRPFFEALVSAVDAVYASETLQRFWRRGTLVANPEGRHPYQKNIPERLRNVPRWFHLSTNLDPQRWRLDDEVPVFTLARVLGEKGSREWLVYAHAPLGERKDVVIKLPEFGYIKVDVAVGGSFFLVQENPKRVTLVTVA